MKHTLTILIVLSSWLAPASARPFETQAQIEARTGGRWCNGAETEDYKIVGYTVDNTVLYVLYVQGISNGEMHVRAGAITEMEAASLLESNRGDSTWQNEKMESSDKGTTAKAWSRKDGKLYAMMAIQNNQSVFMIGTKKAERIMGDLKKMEERIKPRDRIQ
jgi:hypothetical protein